MMRGVERVIRATNNESRLRTVCRIVIRGLSVGALLFVVMIIWSFSRYCGSVSWISCDRELFWNDAGHVVFFATFVVAAALTACNVVVAIFRKRG
jgi:hypothetical protein